MKRWTVDVYLDEQDGWTYAEARLSSGYDTHLIGMGRAKRNPADRDVPQIGDELAAARALSDLGRQLLFSTAIDIEAVTHERIELAH